MIQSGIDWTSLLYVLTEDSDADWTSLLYLLTEDSDTVDEPPLLSLPGRFPSFHWDSLPLTLLQGLSHWLLGLFHTVPRRGASLEWVESLM